MKKDIKQVTKNNDKTLTPKLLHTMTKKEKKVFYEYQIKATRKEVRRLLYWKATSLERVGHVVVCY
ncbi:hypothetical protein KJ756_01295 [Patescibacteria group bacterium]|nr:hypothetical protein [Patescibacteria group bacterium]MCG2809223.1 hypothetical protein [Candidatus Portnoybacteria bacterium]